MHKLFSTGDVHPRDRFDYWHSVACETIVPHNSVPLSRPDFEAELEAGALADLSLVLFKNSPMTVTRTPAQCAKSTSDDLFACYQVSGAVMLEQAGREATMRQGDLLLMDPLLPYVGTFASGTQLLVLKLPRREMEARVGDTASLIVRTALSGHPEAELAASFLASLPAAAGRLASASAETIKGMTLDLMAMALTTAEEQGTQLSSPRAVALLKLRAVIEAGLTNPFLDIQTVTAAAGISARYANSLLAAEGTSLARHILSRRLARCRAALADAQQRHRTISEIALGWGFSDLTHFGRQFKATFGVTPSEFRRLSQSARKTGI